MPTRKVEVYALAQALRTLRITSFDDLSVELIDEQYRKLAQDYQSQPNKLAFLLESYEQIIDEIRQVSHDPVAFSKLKDQLIVEGAKLKEVIEKKQLELNRSSYPEGVRATYLNVSDEQKSPDMIEFIKILYSNTDINASNFDQLVRCLSRINSATFKNLEASFELLERVNQLNFMNSPEKKVRLISHLTYVQVSLVAKSGRPKERHPTLERALILLYEADPEHFKEHVNRNIDDLSRNLGLDPMRSALISALEKTGLDVLVLNKTDRTQTSQGVQCPDSVKTEYLRPNAGEKSEEEKAFIEILYGNTMIDDEKYKKLRSFVSVSILQGIKDSRYRNPDALLELFKRVQALNFEPYPARKIELMGKLLQAQHMLAFRTEMADESGKKFRHPAFESALSLFHSADPAQFGKNIREHVFDYTNSSLDPLMKGALIRALTAKNLEVLDPTPSTNARNEMQKLREQEEPKTNVPKLKNK